MKTVITTDSLINHSVEKYEFKVFTSHEDPQMIDLEEFTQIPFGHLQSSNTEFRNDTLLEVQHRDEFIESLLKKADEMTSDFIKLQMKLEAQEEEFKKRVEVEKKEAYIKGIQEAKERVLAKLEGEKVSTITQFATSIRVFEDSANKYKNALEGIEKKLLEVALSIAKEVIAVELSSNSSKVAYALAYELIKDLQTTSKIKLKVNPTNYDWLYEKIGSLDNIEIISDANVSIGGVVAISNTGNIDAQISSRYKRVKQAVLQED